MNISHLVDFVTVVVQVERSEPTNFGAIHDYLVELCYTCHIIFFICLLHYVKFTNESEFVSSLVSAVGDKTNLPPHCVTTVRLTLPPTLYYTQIYDTQIHRNLLTDPV